MPRAFDTKVPVALHDPTRSDLNFNVQNGDLAQMLLDGLEYLFDKIVEALGDLIGFDFTQFLTDAHQVLQNLKLLFGELNPLGEDFNPVGAVMTFVELMKELLITLPMDIIEGLPMMLAGFLSDRPILTQIVSAITGFVGGGLIDIEKFFANIFNVIPIGALTTAQPNLWPQGMFPADSIAGRNVWTFDAGVTRTADSTGSVKVTANGTMKALRGVATKVVAGQTLDVSLFCRWSGYSGTGSTIQFQLVEYGGVFGAELQIGIVEVKSLSPTTALGTWTEMARTYTVPAGVTAIRPRIVVTADAATGDIHFDDATAHNTGKMQKSWIEGLEQDLSDILGRWQLLLDSIVNVFTGENTWYHSLEDLVLALLNIPFGNVIGVAGPTNIGASILAFIDSLISGLVGAAGVGASLADVFNISKLVSSAASLGSFAWEILGIRNNKPVANGLLSTSDANYPYPNANTYLAVTQTDSLCVTYRAAESAPIGVISWLGHTSANITHFYVNVRKIDPVTGARVLVHHSADIKANLPSTSSPDWVFYELPNPIARLASDDFEIQLVPVGGTHYVKGYSDDDDIPDHPYAHVLAPAATRNETSPDSPSSTIAKGSVTTSPHVMWIETGIDTGNSPGHHDPVTVYFTETTSIPIPTWAGAIDAIPLGAGGGAMSGGTLGFYGEPGHAGKFAVATWVRGVDFDDSVTTVTFSCGAGGAGGHALGSGTDGGDSTFSITGHAVTGAGGERGNQLLVGLASHQPGEGAGTFTFDGEEYVGGGDQNTYGTTGVSPGGGGCGGNWVSFQAGGAGAPGGGWLRFRQGELVIPDTGNPNAPDLELEDVTYSTITVGLNVGSPDAPAIEVEGVTYTEITVGLDEGDS